MPQKKSHALASVTAFVDAGIPCKVLDKQGLCLSSVQKALMLAQDNIKLSGYLIHCVIQVGQGNFCRFYDKKRGAISLKEEKRVYNLSYGDHSLNMCNLSSHCDMILTRF